jgi:hypothetical protein
MINVDTRVAELVLQYKTLKSKWERWLESGDIIDISSFARGISRYPRVAVTKELFDRLFPFAEEAVKDIHVKERIEEMFKKFHQAVAFSKGSYAAFDIDLETTVKKKHSPDEVETFKHGKKKTTTLALYGGRIVDDKGFSALLFGLADSESAR